MADAMKSTAATPLFVVRIIIYLCFATYHYIAAFTTPITCTNVHKSSSAASSVSSIRHAWQQGVEIELPNLELLFERIAMVSPLAKLVMDSTTPNTTTDGFKATVDNPNLKWKKMERNSQKVVHQIDKLDTFQNINTPVLRFRASIAGPCIGEQFSHFIMNENERKLWDDQVDYVTELYPIDNVSIVDTLFHNNVDKYGTCSRVGVGYTLTKAGIISPREQLICGGMQSYHDNGATILWGTEMEEYHNHLLPQDRPRQVRAKTYLFAATLVPTSYNSFDVEYILQMNVGGGVPNFLTTPKVVEVIKKLFDHAATYFEGCQGSLLLDRCLHSDNPEVCSVELLTMDDDDFLDAEIDLTLKNVDSKVITPRNNQYDKPLMMLARNR
jgi:hypothetical protein